MTEITDFATETTLAALNTKIPVDPAKESGKLTTINSTLTTIDTVVDAIKDTAGIKKITDPVNIGTVTTLPAITIAAAQSVNVGTVTTLPTVTLADAENRVLPKAKGKTTIALLAIANNATVTIYTVTAGKTFYLVSGNLAVSGTVGYGTLNLGVGNKQILLALGATGHLACPLNLAVPMPFPAGTVFDVLSTAATVTAQGGIVGWEE